VRASGKRLGVASTWREIVIPEQSFACMMRRMRVTGIAVVTGLFALVAGCKGSTNNVGPGNDSSVDDDGGSGIDAAARIDASVNRVDAGPVPDAAPAAFCTPKAGTNLKLVQVATNLVEPVFVTAPPRDPRLFVLERRGRILIIQNNQTLATPFLDLDSATAGTDRIHTVGNEQGLLGLAFHPEYAQNGLFYLHYNSRANVTIAEYRADPPTSNTAQTTGRVVMRVPHQREQHNGGTVAFGPDGYLYISIGDNGDDAAPRSNGSRLGKILRIDVDTGDPYGIPPSNPFPRAAAPETFAMGLRNPYRFSIDAVTNNLFIGDVGEGAWEEVNVIPAGDTGLDFAWPTCEGPNVRGGSGACSAPGTTAPTFPFSSTPDDIKSVIGGVVYRGTCMTQMGGQYFFGDLYRARIQTFAYAEGQTPTPADHGGDYDIRLLEGNLSSFGTDGFGELYVTTLGFDPLASGSVYRVEVD
jgi:glucose/arabinose dehydrogenase